MKRATGGYSVYLKIGIHSKIGLYSFHIFSGFINRSIPFFSFTVTSVLEITEDNKFFWLKTLNWLGVYHTLGFVHSNLTHTRVHGICQRRWWTRLVVICVCMSCIYASHIALPYFFFRLSLLNKWCGVRDEELSELSGIPGCIFVHASGFIGGNKTYDGALQMALLTLANKSSQ